MPDTLYCGQCIKPMPRNWKSDRCPNCGWLWRLTGLCSKCNEPLDTHKLMGVPAPLCPTAA